MKGLIATWTQSVQDFLPQEISRRHVLMALPDALRAIHFPETKEEAEAGKRRLVFDDLLLLGLGVAMRRQAADAEVAEVITGRQELEQTVLARLGFSLTAGQERVLADFKADMARPRPMTRLLQGDVGSGKTAVALLAVVHAVGSGFQAAIMVPTEVLAEQHYLKAQALLEPVGVRVSLLSGATIGRERERRRQAITTGEVQVAVGTHSLLQEGVTFHRLGLVIVDEQHRFGVKQRAELTAKGCNPHTLVMTAPPIPRTSPSLTNCHRAGNRSRPSSYTRGCVSRHTGLSWKKCEKGELPTSFVPWWKSPLTGISRQQRDWPLSSSRESCRPAASDAFTGGCGRRKSERS